MGRHFLPTACLIARTFVRRVLDRRLSRVPPQGTLRTPAIRQDVYIGRDEAGVPHIFADTAADAAFGFGVATAQDRLWQMSMLRRLGQGRMAELAGDRPVRASLQLGGASLVKLDALYRSLRMEEVAREELGLLADESAEILTSFARGVNAWVEGLRPVDYPPEFLLAGVDPEPWRAEDALLLGKIIAWTLSLSFLAKPSLAMLFGDPELEWLIPSAMRGGTCIVPDGPPSEAARLDFSARAAFGLFGPGVGSNSWVVGGPKTASGRPILCNDPHLLFGLPAFWYPVVLSAPGLEVIGVTMPGIPLVLIGRNRHLAWGITAAMADDGDYYRETLDAGSRYLRNGSWHPIENRTDSFGIRGKAPVSDTLRFVRHEGVLCPLLASQAEPTSYRWVGMEPDRGMDGVLGMNRARSLQEFAAALPHFASPTQNLIAADVHGDFGYFCVGKVPRRPGCNGAPILDGSNPAHAWDGYLAWSEQPRVINPAQGYVATANNRYAQTLPPALDRSFWEPPYRAHRIAALLAGREQIRIADMARMQTDAFSLQAEGLIAALVQPVRNHLSNADARQAADLLAQWDFQMAADSRAATLFQCFYQAILDHVVRPRLDHKAPGLFAQYFSTLHVPVPALDQALLTANPVCFPDGAPAVVERCLAEAWNAASGRRWSELHRLTFRHVLSRAGLAGRLAAWLFGLDRGPFPRPGDGFTINLGAFRLATPFAIEAGPSYRQVVDLGAPEDSRWIVAGGVSGDPASPHYADQIPLWLEGATRPMRFRPRAELERSGVRLIATSPSARGSDCATHSRVL